MKKRFALALVLIVAASSLPALDFVVGPKVMIGDLNWRGDDFVDDNKLSLSYAAGGFVNLQLTNMIGIQPEIYFNYASIKIDDGSWIRYRFPVLTVPVYARFDFDLAKIGVYALAGVRFDFRISDTAKWKNESGTSGDANIGSWNSIFIGAAGGGGVSLPLGPGVLDAGVGVYFGFTKITDGSDVYPWDLDVQVAYGFSF